jgi:glutathione S-transferase
MWMVGELKLPHERIDIAGAFGKNREPDYLALNPNGLVPTLQEDDFVLWESNSIVRYLAAKHGAGTLEPTDARTRARASQWMDWQLTVLGPAIFDLFWGLVRTPPEQRNQAAIDVSRKKTTDAFKIVDAALARRPFLAGDAFCMGDIPVGIVGYRFRELVPERPALPHFERWYAAIAQRPAFREHILSMPLT